MPRGRKPKTAAPAVEEVKEVKVEEVVAAEIAPVEVAPAEAGEIEAAEEAPKKRGRKPGAKNKTKNEAPAKTAKPVKETKPAKAVKTSKETKSSDHKIEVFVEYLGKQYKAEDVIAKIREAWIAEGHRAGSIKSLNVYIKPEESKAYYVINDKSVGGVNL